MMLGSTKPYGLRTLSFSPPLGDGGKQIRSSAWLEHYTDNVGVSSSNLDGSTKNAISKLAN